jgi:hypothetical protein
MSFFGDLIDKIGKSVVTIGDSEQKKLDAILAGPETFGFVFTAMHEFFKKKDKVQKD